MTKVLVAEKVGASGIELLKAHFDVDTAFDQDNFDLPGKIGEYDGILIRSATTARLPASSRDRSPGAPIQSPR